MLSHSRINFDTVSSFSVTFQTLLSLWLLLEKGKGLHSSFYPYLASLPTHYTTPYFCSPGEKQHLPHYLLTKVQDQESQVRTGN